MKEQFIDWAGYYAVRAFAVAVRRLSPESACALGRSLGTVAHILSGRRRVAYADLKAAFGARYDAAARRRLVRRHYEHLGLCLIELLRFPLLTRETVERDIAIPELTRFYEAIHQERGVLLLTAHLGNWELLQIVSGIFGKPIYALMRDQKYPRLNGLLNEFRKSRGSGVVSLGMGLRDLLRALRRSELVGVLGDQSAGKHQGLIVSFFGRKTTIPTGAFELASRTGAVLLPAFITRRENEKHDIYLGAPVSVPRDTSEAEAFRPAVESYVHTLEALITKHPEQWLWAKKRWKYSWTKRLVILSDGKPGHYKQSEAVAEAFQQVTSQYGRPGVEYTVKRIEVRFRSALHRILFFLFGLTARPWAQGHLAWLRLFLTPESAREVEEAGADFVISAGSSLVPVNLWLARENNAKSAVVMKPPFPYNFLRYDLAVVPAHDKGPVPAEAVRTALTLSVPRAEDEELLSLQSELRDPGSVKIAVFLGGPTKGYEMKTETIRELLRILEQVPDGDYLVTTSRRTPAAVVSLLEHSPGSRCQKFVDGSRDTRAGWVPVFLDLAKIVIVTEDSISMISESVGSGKRVIILAAGEEATLPAKHRRFTRMLEQKSAAVRATVSDLAGKLRAADDLPSADLARREFEQLQKRLQEIL